MTTLSLREYRKLAKKPKAPKVYESAVVNACIKWLYLNGCFIWRNNTGAYKPENSRSYVRYGYPGSADILGCTPTGRLLAVECKGTGGKLSPKQLSFCGRVRQHGGIYIVAYGIEDLEKYRKDICTF